MRFHGASWRCLVHRYDDSALVIGVAGGRVHYEPAARWLYSLRLLLLVVKVEVLWTTGEPR